jgi:hypothetical protein
MWRFKCDSKEVKSRNLVNNPSSDVVFSFLTLAGSIKTPFDFLIDPPLNGLSQIYYLPD